MESFNLAAHSTEDVVTPKIEKEEIGETIAKIVARATGVSNGVKSNGVVKKETSESAGSTGEQESKVVSVKKVVEEVDDLVHSTGSDDIMNISSANGVSSKKKKSKSEKRRARKAKALEAEANGSANKRRVVFKLNNNVTREFHMHSKVATRSLAESTERAKPLKAAIKKRDVKADSKKQRKSGGVGFQC